jgi:hypothetical protein
MNAQEQLNSLATQIRWLKVYCISASALLAILLLGAAAKAKRFDELTVERLNVVDPAGQLRVVISNAERFPPPIIDGKPFRRVINPAGLVFYNTKGDEVGGLAITDQEAGRLSAVVFDYSNADAIGLLTRISPDGKDGTAGLVINSRPSEALDTKGASDVQKRRIELQNRNEVAELVLFDSQGRPRLRVFVDEQDHPAIEMLDEKGASVYSLRR